MKKKVVLLFLLTGAMVVLFFQYAGADNSLKALEKNVKALWEARMERDNATIYDFADLDFQKKIEKRDFIRSAGLSPNHYEIKEVILDDSGKAGKSTVTFEAVKMGNTFSNIHITEDWIYQEGQWRIAFSHQRNPFEMKKQ